MRIETHELLLETKGHSEIIDITSEVRQLLNKSGLKEGQVSIFGIGSTTGITTLEYEPGLVKTDVHSMLNKFAPYGFSYEHNKTWGDDNGAAHLRSFLIGTSQSFAFYKSELLIGTWQQIVFVDFDTRPRSRSVVVQISGV